MLGHSIDSDLLIENKGKQLNIPSSQVGESGSCDRQVR